ncbi:bifunctional [glutamate--ammonia ligase]-adenylyl-L-tyrosine phosphorylase/[glutamate--ammonia-ligase] adenylyltransferase [Neiella marina]|uniref:Bifunctional glutamine synthetase adenylyltransferase/adenylyl-removing enzyme n=1 Tax=Neiella holothuriorum TaxID=2870530 RepID=A0ABS7EBI7_9GAMM|nr:bifunctional [glutamate--ammonia ligase]-adenylyl-L-tyrosine phosphorylase/[glutamate--ammonia-ligase] adenylyltransferase [Neiella holothuriorum]MBW8189702.1 bifunctional [glutamate--ammonia ligase]-adenylyl-L-tyrosine phosphorylase/[glutamate--ammonia-ligase] adenylyltransferase [Neiella holothuriorum]
MAIEPVVSPVTMPVPWQTLTAELQQHGLQQWQKLADDHDVEALEPYKQQLCHAMALSDFLFEIINAQPAIVADWLAAGTLATPLSHVSIAKTIQDALADVDNEPALMSQLRKARKQIQFHIIWRDLLGEASLDEVLEATSALADEAICQANDWLYHDLTKRWGVPSNADGKPQPLLIIGMGKLGGAELNVSSDVDLIFTYPEAGQTQGVRRQRDNQEFFIRLGQRLISALNQATADGSVFRVDMRLRPFGDSGPLVMPFSALEDYYQHHGREWERYAMVKARVLGANNDYAAELKQMLMPFVYRRYIDFSAIQSLRKMKLLIEQEVRRRQLAGNVKLGAGGIREVEFVAQTVQLMRGGRAPELRCRNLLQTLQVIDELAALPDTDMAALANAYRYLRKLEHALQGLADAQTQTLPDTDFAQLRVAAIMGCDDWQQLNKALDEQRQHVRQAFGQVIGEPPGDDDPAPEVLQVMPLWPDVWQQELVEGACQELNIESSERFLNPLQTFYDKTKKRQLGPRGRDALERVMPLALAIVCQTKQPATTLAPVLGVIETVLTRTTYLELLLENPKALQQLVSLCESSSWIASELANHPMLLDELLEPAQLYRPTELEAYGDELRQFMMRIDDDDLEQQMEALRHFKQAQQLRIAAADVTGGLAVTKVSDHLTRLAEVLLDYCVHAAWAQLTERHGTPDGINSAAQCIAVLGYGKLGGFELGYGSDLDIVFFHMVPRGVTTGDKPIDTTQFLVKLVQRFSHLMTTRTHSGELYEIDLRLRPSGASGLLITHLDALAEYQKQEAWVWEHQALVRARAVFGAPQLHEAFAELRREIVCLPRNMNELAVEVVKMRHKMREHLGSDDESKFDLKQDPGGIADIEFIAQYLVLAFGQALPSMADWSDNLRIFETAAEQQLLTTQQAGQLTHAYCSYRNRGHHLSLQNQKAMVSATEFGDERQQVMAVWQHLFADVEQRL